MRYLMLFTLGFCGGTAFCAYCVWDQPAIWLLAALVCFFLLLLCLWMQRKPGRAAAVCLLGVCVSMLWYLGYDGLYLKSVRQMDQQILSTEIEAVDYSFSSGFGSAVDGTLQIAGKSYRVRLYLTDTAEIEPGDVISGRFRLRYTASGGYYGSSFHQGDGIFLLAYAQDGCQIDTETGSFARHIPVAFREKVLSIIEAIFPDDTQAFASALLLGEDDALSYEDNTALKLSGIRHVVAVSGQHLVILMAAIIMLTGRSRRIACYISIPVTVLFSAMAGFTPSILRACVMQLVMLGAFLSKRDYDGPTALSFAVLLMVLYNPLAITSVSLQLSVASIMGMFQYSSKIYKRIQGWYFFKNIAAHTLAGKIFHWIVGSVCVTLGSMVVTVPLSAVYFRTVSLIGIVTNLVTLWLITVIFYGVILAVAAGAVYSGAGLLLGKGLSVPIHFVLKVSKGLSAVPGGCLFLRNEYIIAAVIAAYAVLILMLYWKQLRFWVGSCLISCILFLGIVLSWTQPLQDAWRITMLDVGQGQCVILQSGERCYMVDCGGDYPEGTADIAAETLLSMGISRLDGLILTHFDTDHICGAEHLLTRIQVDHLILPEDPAAADAAKLMAICDGTVITAAQDLSFSWDSGKITVFAGNGGQYGNEMSLCVLFQSENCDILITGDRPVATEAALLLQRELPELEILVAGHHGAKTSTGNLLLAYLKPKTVLISAGENNRFGHPATELLERLKAHGCKIYRTDLQGTIVIRR